MLVEIHVLQTHCPSNLNRDELGAPKTAMFGGSERARISSQCLKRNIRKSDLFIKAFPDKRQLQTRTFPEMVREHLLGLPENDRPKEPEVKEIVESCKKIASKKEKGGKDQDADDDREITPQAVKLGPKEAEEFVRLLMGLRKEKKEDYALFLEMGKKQPAGSGKKQPPKRPSPAFWEELRKAYKPTVDIAMFGRMTTSDAFANVEASVQVAHAISTDEAPRESDWFTAEEDKPREMETGAAYASREPLQYTSGTFYKYFNLHWEGFVKNTEANHGLTAADAEKALAVLVCAAACSIPSGKRNSFGQNNLPDFVLVEVKKDNMPTNYANAFLHPVRWTKDKWGEHNVMDASIERVGRYISAVRRGYGIDSDLRWFATNYEPWGDDCNTGKAPTAIAKDKRVASLRELARFALRQVLKLDKVDPSSGDDPQTDKKKKDEEEDPRVENALSVLPGKKDTGKKQGKDGSNGQ